MVKKAKKKAKSGRTAKSARKKTTTKKTARKAAARKAPKAVKRPKARRTGTASRAKKMAAPRPQPLGATPLKGQANMIVTFDPNHRGTAELELREVLKQAGEKPQIGQTEIEGLFKVAVSNARQAVAKIKSLCKSNPNLFSVTHHFTPIDNWCQSDVQAMQKLIRQVSEDIETNEKWKMGLNKRHWDKLEGVQLIIKLTDVVDRKNVDLDNPDKIVQVEIIGKEAGIALLAPKDVLDVAREKEG
ncbi:MAG TPA: THUMP domain-containing protein [Candidatus Nanoarchaeia archaeon]|nr:THUMP domain-containing protein [Candidatus Nanoarchaeia archaeon]